MSSFELEFEAMMAGITAPPISLQEFRLFVEHDPAARNALAFCEWYQRYKTVYFDRDFIAPTVLTSTSSRPGIPSDFIPSVRKRVHGSTCINMRQNDRSASSSVPNTMEHLRDEAMRGKMLSLKSHSFSVLSEGMIKNEFRTVSTSANGSFSNKHMVSTKAAGAMKFLSQDNLQGESCVLPIKACSFGRRHTLHTPDGLYESNVVNAEQEQRRAAIQSLLIFECWARFLCAGTAERIDIPEAELMYLTERLPLNVTHLPQPLLCRNDMLVSQDLENIRTSCSVRIGNAVMCSMDESKYLALVALQTPDISATYVHGSGL
ncbi:hypothetical protein IWW36_004457 [Coemansia brasiliensis]|uniref:Uncharacterized protein n=1 Tax=Coemansia brasiliensis TaxID=2650707 RepID=A0A9W8I899_9FUNG|nr:hypothetical protein IWW36_004457 [Coemansia brasiliensis]